MYACIHSDDAAALAGQFSPFVEMIDSRTAVFSITARQIEAVAKLKRVAIAATIDAALIAARHFDRVIRIEAGDEARVLGPLPIDVLPPDPEIFETLDMWGIRTLGEFARLPENGIAERLGERGLRLHRMARGAIDRPLKPEKIEIPYEEAIEFDHPLELLEPLLLTVGRFLNDLCGQLDRRSMSAGSLKLTLNRTERNLQLPFPTRDAKFLLKLVQHDLEAHKPDEPVEKIRVKIVPAESRRVQHDLFEPSAPEPEKLELTLGKIRALVGAENVKTPELRDTHRPGWSVPEMKLAFRYFRPPMEARVETEEGIPKQIATRVFRGKIAKSAGPWRTSGDWWRDEAWNRDEWDIAVADGALYRIYRAGAAWFVEGIYD
jgi:protein ImuB